VQRDAGDARPGYALLDTKLNVPSVRTNLVTRPRLLRRLDEGATGNLTLVCAPAGFGKSTLLGDWILRRGLAVGWVSLDEDDNDPARFLSYLAAALQSAAPDIGESASKLIGSPQPPTRVILTTLVNEVAAVPKDFALVLDDYHLIEDEAVHGALAFLLQHLPPQMHLVVASRTEPPLPLSRLLAGGDLTNLTASDLRFTYEEAADFLGDAMGLDLSADDVAALEERTEGWIAALQLAALSMQGREDVSGFVSAFAGTERHVFDYLAEEVLDRQTEETRTFLLRTSVLDRLSGPLCDAVTGQEQARTMLERLERMNLLLVPLDDRRLWYRYHHLFSDFLRQRLQRENPETFSGLHRRASVWHEANGTAGEAIGHALAAGDFERAAGMIERLADSMFGRGEVPMLARLVRSLPQDIMRSRPRLYMSYTIFVLMENGRWDAAEAALRDVERMLGIGAVGVAEPVKDEERTRLAGDMAGVRANIAWEGHGDLPNAIALNRRALELLAGDEWRALRGIPANNLVECLLDMGDLPAAEIAIDEAQTSHAIDYPADITWTLIQHGRLLTIQGRLSEARKMYERVLRFTAEHNEAGLLLDTGVAHVRIGELLFEWNDLEEATRHLLDGIQRTLEWVGLGEATSRLLESTETHDRLDRLAEVDADAAHGVVPGYIALARVRLAQGDAQGALDALDKIERVAQNSRVSPLWRDRTERWGAAWRARLWMAEGNLRAAKRWSQNRDLGATDDPDYASELEYITLARLLLAQGKLEAAANLLGRLMDAAETGGRRRTVIELLVLQALVLRAQNVETGALAALKRALLLAEPEGYVRTFADEGGPMTDLLRRLLKAWRKEQPDDVPFEYVGTLLEVLGVAVTVPTGTVTRDAAGLALEPITGRELEVLRLLDSDLSNREIAGRLYVSLDTIKSHTKHLYAKLGVHTRHQAVARARDLKLL
jgi:LuxR family maltose regulon positive regulatory protein